MGERVKVDGRMVKVSREKGYLYFVGGDGNIYRTKMQHKGRKKTTQTKMLVQKTGLTRDNQKYVYYVDGSGYLARAKRGKR